MTAVELSVEPELVRFEKHTLVRAGLLRTTFRAVYLRDPRPMDHLREDAVWVGNRVEETFGMHVGVSVSDRHLLGDEDAVWRVELEQASMPFSGPRMARARAQLLLMAADCAEVWTDALSRGLTPMEGHAGLSTVDPPSSYEFA